MSYYLPLHQVNEFEFSCVKDLCYYLAALCPYRRALISHIRFQFNALHWIHSGPEIFRKAGILLRECTGIKALTIYIVVKSFFRPIYLDEESINVATENIRYWTCAGGPLRLLHPKKLEVIDLRITRSLSSWDPDLSCEIHLFKSEKPQLSVDNLPHCYESPEGILLFHRQDPISIKPHHLHPFVGPQKDIRDLLREINIERDHHPLEVDELTRVMTTIPLDIWGEGRANGETKPALVSSRTRSKLKADIVNGTVRPPIWSATTANISNVQEIIDARIDTATSDFQFKVVLATGNERP